MGSSRGGTAGEEIGRDLGVALGENHSLDRLKEGRRIRIIEKAAAKQEKLIAIARQRASDGVQEGQGLFFLLLFQLAGESIEADVETFCDRAEEVFEEIEAYGQEPQLDEVWLGEVTGEKDIFNFSTENLVSDLISPPRKKRKQKQLSQEEIDRLREEVENAILDDDHKGEEEQDYQQTLAVAHGENVTEWIEYIKTALQNSKTGILEFWTLNKRTRLQPTELFLGLLLGQKHWEIGQSEFYGEVTVRIRGKKEGRKERN